MSALPLTVAEKALFAKLSQGLREGWEVTEIVVTPEQPEELEIRRKMASFEDPVLREFSEQLSTRKEKDRENTLRTLHPQALSGEQLAEICFVLGVAVLSQFIAYLLTQVQTDEDIEGIAGLAEIRRMLSDVNSHASS